MIRGLGLMLWLFWIGEGLIFLLTATIGRPGVIFFGAGVVLALYFSGHLITEWQPQPANIQ